MNIRHCILISLTSLLLLACNEDPTGDAPPADQPGEGEQAAKEQPAADKAAETKPAAAASCDAVIDRIASFNPGSGAPERELWAAMCDEMSAKERSCVAKAGDMAGLEACMKHRANEKLK